MAHDRNELIGAIYQGPFEDRLWSTFLSLLQSRAGAEYVGLFFRPPDHPRRSSLHLYSARGAPSDFETMLTKAFEEEEPSDWLRLPECRVFNFSEIYGAMTPHQRKFYEGRFDAGIFRHSWLIRIGKTAGLMAWLTISRSSTNFPGRMATLLEFIVPHLATAIQTYEILERERFRADISEEAIRHLDYGWISLSRFGRVSSFSSCAMDIVSRHHELSVDERGLIIFDNATLNAEFQGTLRKISADISVPPKLIRISGEPYLELLLVPVRNKSLMIEPRPVALAYLHSDGNPTQDRERQISELFGLLPSEARLALAIARGLSLVEAAAQLGIMEKTARSYSKQIYAKMGARGQPDVVRFILNSVLMLA